MFDPPIEAATLTTLAALLSQRQTADSIAPDEWPLLIEVAQRHGLGQMLLWTLKQPLNDAGTYNAQHEQLLMEAARAHVVRYIFQKNALLQVSQVLRAANIPALWLKGAGLAHTIYPDPTLRPMSDLDVLVPFEQYKTALAVLQEHGFILGQANSLPANEALVPHITHHYQLWAGAGRAVLIELHFRLLRKNESPIGLEESQWFWQTPVTATVDGAQFNTPQPTAHLLYLCAHTELHHHGTAQLYLQRYFDMHQLISQRAIDWEALVSHAGQMQWSHLLWRALSHASDYFGTAIPAAVLAQLAEASAASDSAAPRVTMMHGLPLRSRLALLRRVIFPSARYLRQRDAKAATIPLWRLYLRQWQRITGIALARAGQIIRRRLRLRR